tara:strand:- start:287 stop:868 length:582 start_codon:yes stop_codon:yes gene_type:complete
MKIINSDNFIKLSQRFYNPDDDAAAAKALGDMYGGKPLTTTNPAALKELADAVEQEQDLPVLTPDDLESLLEDSFDDEVETPEEAAPEELETPISDEEFPDFESTLEGLEWGEDNNKVVRIYYVTKGGRDIERNVEPHGQFYAKTTGNRILVTFDRTVGDIRAFIVDRIMYYTFTGHDFDKKFVVFSKEDKMK